MFIDRRVMRSVTIASAFAIASMVTATFVRAEVGVSPSTITLGMSAPFTGPNGAYGIEMREAISAYLARVNEAGGVNGRKLQLVAMDDGYETVRTVANTRALLDEHKVFALVGYYGSSPTTEAMKVFSAARTPLVGTISGADSLRNPAERYMFNVRASYADETEAIVNQLVALKMTRIAVFYQNDGFGQSGLSGVTAALKTHGLEPAAAVSVERNSLDVTNAVQTIAKASPQAVVMVTLYKPTAEFVRKLHQAGQYPQLTTLSPVGADMLVTELGKEARGIVVSQVMPYPRDDAVPAAREYRRLMATEGNHKVSYYGIEGFITAKVLVEAIRRAGKDLTREKLVGVLDATDVDLGGYRVAYAPQSRGGSKFVDLTIIGGGGKIVR